MADGARDRVGQDRSGYDLPIGKPAARSGRGSSEGISGRGSPEGISGREGAGQIYTARIV